MIDLGYTQNQIDEMDILYHLKLLGQRKKDNKQEHSENEYITFDQIADHI